MKQPFRRTLSMLLSVAMIFSMTGMSTVFATEGNTPIEGGTITAFAPLTENVASQGAPQGTAQEDLGLPKTLAVTVERTVAEPATPSDAAIGTSDVTDSGEPTTVTVEISLPVTWDCAEYDPTAEIGTEFTFAPEWDTDTYPLGEGVEIPAITVTLTERPMLFGGGRSAPVTVTTPAELLAALAATTPATINVGTDITLDSYSPISLETSHTLNIAEGKILSIGNNQLKILVGTTLTLGGPGTLKTEVIYNSTNPGILVNGTLALLEDSKLTTANGGSDSIGIKVASGGEMTGAGDILVENSPIASKENCNGIVIDAGGTVNLTGGTLTVKSIDATGLYGTGTLATKDTAIEVANTGDKGILTKNIFITGGTVNIDSKAGKTGATGIQTDALTLDSTTVTVQNIDGTGIFVAGDDTFITLKATTLNLQNTAGSGLSFLSGGKLNMDTSSVINMQPNAPDDENATGMNGLAGAMDSIIGGAKIKLTEGTRLLEVHNCFSDRSIVHTDSGFILVGAENATASASGLSAGDYVWDGMHFAKGGDDTAHAVTVQGGTADPATAKVGITVTLTAAAPAGKLFKEWKTDSAITFVEETSKTDSIAKFTMPIWAVSVSAVYEDIFNAVAVTDGTADPATAKAGDTITLTANVAPDGKQFKEWEISPAVTFVDSTDKTGATAKFTMPAEAVTAVAVYEDIYAVTVTGGTASTASAAMGETITLTANTAPDGKQFKEWTITPAVIFVEGTSKTSATAKFTMPAETVAVVAVYEDIPTYAITVTDGTASLASAAKGETITLTASTAPSGQQFKAWTITPTVTFVEGTSKTSATAKFTMPAGAVTATAAYEDIPYSISVTKGTASPTKAAKGATVTLTANPIQEGKVFRRWTITPAVTFAEGTDNTSATAKFTMPAEAVTATAVYESVVIVKTAAALKKELQEINAYATIYVEENIELTSDIILGDSHRLYIAPGKNVYTASQSNDYVINILAEKTLSLAGAGKLVVNNGIPGSSGIIINGTLSLASSDSKLRILNVGENSYGVRLQDGEINGIGTIHVQNSGKSSYGIGMRQSFKGNINLTGGKLTVENSGADSTGISATQVATSGTDLNVSNTAGIGIALTQKGHSLTLKDSTVTVNPPYGESTDTGISVKSGTVTLEKTTINLKNSSGIGMSLGVGSPLTMDEVSVINISSASPGAGLYGLASATRTIKNGARITLVNGSKLEKVENCLMDQGVLCTTADLFTVSADSATAIKTGLTAGNYIWKDGYFTKPEPILINEQSFPDANFRAYINTWLVSQDGKLTAGEIAGRKQIYVDGLSITTLKGIEHFTALSTLDCSNNQLIALDVTGLKELEELYCQDNYMPNESAVVGFTGVWDNDKFIFAPQHAPGFKAVTSITGVPTEATVNVPLTLTGTVFPVDATNKDITWSLAAQTPDTTGSTITGGVLTATAPGTAHITATITNGTAEGVNYEQNFTVTVTAGTTTYPVTVIDGMASPNAAAAGATVTLVAGAAPTGQRFKEWTITPTDNFTDGTSKTDATAKITMPAGAVTAMATFENIPSSITGVTVNPTTASVQKGTTRQFYATVSGTGSFTDTVTWTVTDGGMGTSIIASGLLTVAASETASTLTVTATSTADATKSASATVTVTNTPVTTYVLTVTGGTGGGNYAANATVSITAGTAPTGKQFKNWTASPAVTFANANSASTTFTMPAEAVTVTANFEDIPATITGVSINPTTANVQKGTTRQFNATVSGTGSFVNTVSWTVTGGGAGTNINASGLLTVAAGETASALTVKATSTADTSKFANATVTVTSTPVTTYALTVTGGTGGGNYEAGAQIKIIANAPAVGKVFDKWVLTSGGGTLANASSPQTTYTMPANAATVTATYQNAPGTTYTITFNANGGSVSPSSMTTGTDGKLASLPTPTRSDYRFDGWYTAASGGTPVNTSTLFTSDDTIFAHWTYTGGGGGSSGSDSGSSGGSNITTGQDKPTTEQPKPTMNATTEIKGTVGTDGKLNVNVPEDKLLAALAAAQKADTAKNGVSVTVKVTTDKTASSIAATLPQNAINELAKAGVTELRIESGTVNITISLATLTQLSKAKGDVTVSANAVKPSTLSKEAQAAIGNRPVFDLTITAGGKAVTNFDGDLSVALPYTLAAGENPGNLYGVYVAPDGKVTYLLGSSYDANVGLLRFSSKHFSVFGIGYKADAPKFTDITGHWAKDSIDFVAARGLLTGTGATTFSPNTGMTRGMFVTALGRLAGIDSTKYKNTKFTDVAADAYYAPYTAWALEKGITSGTTATTFSPDKTITRQELAVFMQNYAKAMGYTIPKIREEVKFADAASISSWAKDAVKAMQMAGVMNGKNENKFDPTGTATRAEVAATLHRYVELVIDVQTAQGLDVNDSGSAMMFENGKAVKSASRTTGSGTYNFNANGEAALLPTKKTGTYTVQRGDSFWLIAKKVGCTMTELEQLNGKSRNDLIYAGMVLKVPVK